MKSMIRLFGWLIAPCLGIAAMAIAQSIGHALWSLWMTPEGNPIHGLPPWWVWLACPAAFALRAFWSLFCKRMNWDNPWSFIDTLEHELTHALFGYLTLNPPVSLKASLSGDGEVTLKGQNPLTLLSPYFFPLFTVIAVLLRLWVAKDYRIGFTVLCLGLLGSFLFRLLAEFRWRQTDLHGYGFVFSTCLVAVLLMGTLGVMLSLMGLLPWQWLSRAPLFFWKGFGSVGREILAGIHWVWNYLGIPFKWPG